MSEKIVVPEGMLEAAASIPADAWYEGNKRGEIEERLGAALRWLSERIQNMRVPNKTLWQAGRNHTIDEVLGLFCAPEPEVPEEIKDLLIENDTVIRAYSDQRTQPRTFNSMLLEAYRRGQKAGSK